MAGYSGTPLVDKLGLKAGMRVRLLDAPEPYGSLLGEPVEALDVSVLEADDDDTPADFTHLFATGLDTLRAHFAAARRGMAPDGMVWASWPKKSSDRNSEIDRSHVMREGKAAGLVDIKVAAVDETWSGLKFVVPVAER